jgi:hypothetical protein
MYAARVRVRVRYVSQDIIIGIHEVLTNLLLTVHQQSLFYFAKSVCKLMNRVEMIRGLQFLLNLALHVPDVFPFILEQS